MLHMYRRQLSQQRRRKENGCPRTFGRVRLIDFDGLAGFRVDDDRNHALGRTQANTPTLVGHIAVGQQRSNDNRCQQQH